MGGDDDSRPASKFAGQNHVHFGDGLDNHVTLPVIPPSDPPN